ncbi:hypothetical protein [Roseinatronobacter sp. S2]|uniref:DUF7742 family protein n=1 Tax=Roseinatronobacter sp. S2 TaxID=3035471 RepID=UPI00240F0203|nr:hypothetical protein [Roseinatronobacter sp. S2]WFE76051.1 hypothetical protein P8S53_06530 [Roseinatronobacter sp. S2]
MMREITHGDICAAARVLMARPRDSWPRVMAALLAHAHCADCYRKRCGKVHPQLGNGTLMAAALACHPVACPRPSDRAYLDAIGAAIGAVLDWRAGRRRPVLRVLDRRINGAQARKRDI